MSRGGKLGGGGTEGQGGAEAEEMDRGCRPYCVGASCLSLSLWPGLA